MLYIPRMHFEDYQSAFKNLKLTCIVDVYIRTIITKKCLEVPHVSKLLDTPSDLLCHFDADIEIASDILIAQIGFGSLRGCILESS